MGAEGAAKGEAIRGVAALLVIGLVVALIVADRRGEPAGRADDPVPTISTPSEDPDPDPEVPSPSPPIPSPPIPSTDLPTPPPGLEDLVCQHLEPTPLRVLSFNTKRAEGSLEAVAAEVRAVGADVVLLQEVDRGVPRSGGVDQPAAYAEALEMGGSFSANLAIKGGEYGTLVLSRHEIVQEGRVPLPGASDTEPSGASGTPPSGASGTEPRVMQWVTLDVDGRLVRVFNTHLQSVGGAVRREQARVVAGVLAVEELPAILGGDLNAVPGSAPILTIGGVLTDVWVAGRGSELTGRTRRIDYLFVNDHVTPVRARVARSAASDHHRLWADVEVGPGAQCQDEGDQPEPE